MVRPHTLVLGYGWRDGVPFLKLRRNEGRGKVLLRKLEGALRLGIGPQRCVGWLQGRSAMPCPDEAIPESGKRCAACDQRDGFRPCMICDGFRCPPLQPTIQRSCEQDHALYLACFGDRTIKVGTASAPRRDARLIEQGPLAAARIALGPGPRIKQMEHILSTTTSLVEGMRRSRKLTLLKSPMSVQDAKELIGVAHNEATTALRDQYRSLLHPLDFVTPPPLAVRTRKELGIETELGVHEGRLVAGQIVGAVGHVLVLQDGGRFFVDLGELKGRLIDPDPPADVRRAPVQLGLL